MKDIKLLRTEVLFGRTHSGREIGEKAIPLIHDAIEEIEQNGDLDLIECRNCQFVAGTLAFGKMGCPNCGCKLHDVFVGVERPVRKRED